MTYYIAGIPCSGDELYHHGTKGQRWGRRLYQNPDGSLTALGRLRYLKGGAPTGDQSANSNPKPRHGRKSLVEQVKAKKVAKQRAANLQKAREAKQAKRTYQQEKKAALEKGDAASILKFKGDLTNQEMQAAVNRLNLERQLAQAAEADKPVVKSGMEKLNDAMAVVSKLKDHADTGIKAWNTIAKITNSLADTDLPIISEKSKSEQMAEKAKKALEAQKQAIINAYIARNPNANVDNTNKLKQLDVDQLEKVLASMQTDTDKASADAKRKQQEEQVAKSKREKEEQAAKSKREKEERARAKDEKARAASEIRKTRMIRDYISSAKSPAAAAAKLDTLNKLKALDEDTLKAVLEDMRKKEEEQ